MKVKRADYAHYTVPYPATFLNNLLHFIGTAKGIHNADTYVWTNNEDGSMRSLLDQDRFFQ